jgi:hypothetical protein
MAAATFLVQNSGERRVPKPVFWLRKHEPPSTTMILVARKELRAAATYRYKLSAGRRLAPQHEKADSKRQ